MRYEVAKELKKCLHCKKPSCIDGCPVNTNIPKIIEYLENDELQKAIELQYQYNSISFICGELCDHNRQCIGKCNNKKNLVNIGTICKYLGLKRLEKDIILKEKNNINIAVIGGGVSGLVCAELLLEAGFNVTIFEKQNYLGGVLKDTLPDFRYDKTILDNWLSRLIKLGLKAEYNYSFGDNLNFDNLKKFDEIIISTGAPLPKRLFSENFTFDALSILKEISEKKCRITNKEIIILGGGNTAFDVARSLKRLNNSVTIAYRRDIANSPASKNEIMLAKEEGINILECLSPNDIIIENNSLTGINFYKTELIDSGENRKSFKTTNELISINCDIVVEALGASPNLSKILNFNSSLLDQYGYAKGICNDHLYIVGDAFLGPSSFVKANLTSRIAVGDIIKKYENKKRVLFGGSFNPPTIAHYEIIKYLALCGKFNEVLILPNGDSYTFGGKVLDNFKNRVEMLKIICQEFENVKILETENKESFKGTQVTLEILNHPYFVLGDDCLEKFHLWKNFEKLVSENKFIVINRNKSFDVYNYLLNNEYLKDYLDNFEIININTPDVSSSDFRDNNNENVVSEEVLQYIKNNKLYGY